MWPTPWSLPLLVFGLLPLGYVAITAARRGLAELVSLKCVGVLFLWTGYHLSPWIYYFLENWDRFLLVDDLLDDGLAFSTLAMVVFIAGCTVAERGKHDEQDASCEAAIQAVRPVRGIHLAWLCAGLVMLFLIRVGGLSEAWASTSDRGIRGLELRGTVLFYVAMLHPMLALATACMTALYVLQSPPGLQARRIGQGFLCLLVASLDAIWNFSRSAGYPFAVLAFVMLRARGRRGAGIAVACVAIAGFLGSVAYSSRSQYHPGLGNFLKAATGRHASVEEPDGIAQALAGETNPLDAMSAWTLKASLVDSEQPTFSEEGIAALLVLQPLPSFLLPTRPIGPSLNEVRGLDDTIGLTTPALAEAYYAFGVWGVWVMVPLGLGAGWLDRQFRHRPGLVAWFSVVLYFASFPLGLHNGLRAASRLPIYALAAVAIARQIRGMTQPPGETASVGEGIRACSLAPRVSRAAYPRRHAGIKT